MIIDSLLALAPILIILVLMLGFRWGAARAGPIGWATAIVIAVLRFGTGLEILALAQSKAFLLTLDVLLIVWGAFLLYRVADEAGAIRILGEALPQLTSDRGMQALLIAWVFASFLQGVGGFGVPVAVTAPILISLGFNPMLAVVMPAIGHGWTVSFGSLASSFQALMAASHISGDLLAAPTALLLGLAGLVTGYMVAHVADGWKGVRRLLLPVFLLAVTMGATQLALATAGFWSIASLGSGMAGLLLGLLLARRYQGQAAGVPRSVIDTRKVALALSGYLALIVFTLIIQLVPAVREFLNQFVIRLPFPEMTTARGFTTAAGYGRSIPIFRHAGAILAYSALTSFFIYRKAGLLERKATQRILAGTVTRVIPSSLGIAAMVSMAVIMSHAGMTDALARGLAQGVGGFFPLASSWIGALGAFMTGSNTNSNVVFAMMQRRTAEILGRSVPLILAAQSAGGAIGSVAAPTKVVVGASTAGMADQEGPILRKLFPYIGLLIAFLSLLTILIIGIWPT
ncbi:MAG: L-lactate permease [Anaerolineales bacterium]|jgi:lactate permease